MAETDPATLGGNALAQQSFKFEKLSEAMSKELREKVQKGLDIAEKILDGSSITQVRRIQKETKLEVALHTSVAVNNRTHIAGTPAKVLYGAQKKTFKAGNYMAGNGYDYQTSIDLGRKLEVTFNPDEDNPEVFMFDFYADDPVEEVARLAMGMRVDGVALPFETAVDTTMQIIAEAAESVQR